MPFRFLDNAISNFRIKTTSFLLFLSENENLA
jgi:hypothetical protein